MVVLTLLKCLKLGRHHELLLQNFKMYLLHALGDWLSGVHWLDRDGRDWEFTVKNRGKLCTGIKMGLTDVDGQATS